MLGNLLPGLRETRTSFTIGAGHLGWIVLLFAATTPSSFEQNVFSDALTTIARTLGRPFLLALLTFATYSVGHLLLSGIRIGSDWALQRSFFKSRHWLWSDGSHRRLRAYAEDSSIDITEVVHRVPTSRTRLLGTDKDLYDRMQTRRYGSLLRFGFAPALPLLAMTTSLHIAWSPAVELVVVLAAVLLTLVLWVEAVREFRVALSIIVREVTTGRLDLDLYEGYDRRG